jgi:hypothetical protein
MDDKFLKPQTPALLTFLKWKKSIRAALSSSRGGRNMKKKMLEGLMPNQMVLALPM